MAQRLGSFSALARPVGRCRAGALARHRPRRVTIVRAKFAAAKNSRARADELVDDVFSVVRTVRNGTPLAEENQKRLEGLLKELLRSCARNPARNALLAGSYELLWASRPTAGPITPKSQIATVGPNGDYTNTARFALAGLLPGVANQYGKYNATGPNSIEVTFDKSVIDKGVFGKDEREESRETGGYRKFQIEYLGEDALVLKALVPQKDPPTQLVFKRVPQMSGQMSQKAVAASEDLRAEKSSKAVKIMAEKQAAQRNAIAAAEKLRAEKSRQAAILMEKKEAEKKATKAKAEQDKKEAKVKAERKAKQAAMEAERLQKEKAAAAVRQQQLKERIGEAVQTQRAIVSEAQAASRAAVQDLRAAERDAQSVLREAATSERKAAAAAAATAKAVAEAEKTVSAQKEADTLIREMQQEILNLQKRAKALKV